MANYDQGDIILELEYLLEEDPADRDADYFKAISNIIMNKSGRHEEWTQDDLFNFFDDHAHIVEHIVKINALVNNPLTEAQVKELDVHTEDGLHNDYWANFAHDANSP